MHCKQSLTAYGISNLVFTPTSNCIHQFYFFKTITIHPSPISTNLNIYKSNIIIRMATTPVSFEASFAKAMRLLQSPSKDAGEQLKAMLDECLAQKKAPPIPAPKQQTSTVKPVVANKAPVTVPEPILVPADDIDCTSLSCVVCKRFEHNAGNAIVECQECHSLYHQECHKPSLANENVKDPRFVWYCSTCTNKRKRIKLPGKPAISVAGNGSTAKDTREQQNPEVSPFKSWSFLKK